MMCPAREVGRRRRFVPKSAAFSFGLSSSPNSQWSTCCEAGHAMPYKHPPEPPPAGWSASSNEVPLQRGADALSPRELHPSGLRPPSSTRPRTCVAPDQSKGQDHSMNALSEGLPGREKSISTRSGKPNSSGPVRRTRSVAPPSSSLADLWCVRAGRSTASLVRL
jgi:hypothetical protein